MLNQIEMNMYAITLNKTVGMLKEQTNLMKQYAYDKALNSGIEKICTIGFQEFMHSFDKMYNFLEDLEYKISIKNNFSSDDFKYFIDYVTSEKFKKQYM